MKIDIKKSKDTKEIRIIIETKEVDDEVLELASKISSLGKKNRKVLGRSEDLVELIDEDSILRIYSSNQKVYIESERGIFTSKNRLYELEDNLKKEKFVRISNSEIVNIDKVINLDLSIGGTIVINLENKESSYVSRRYMKKVKEVLGIWKIIKE